MSRGLSHQDSHYIADIDGLRAVAVAAVLAFHFFPDAVAGGFLGVDVFFVISGFVISRILLVEVIEGRFSLAAFYGRRIVRLMPALLVTLYATAIAGAVLFFSDEYSALSMHIGAGLAFVSNFLLWHEAGYFDHEAATKPLLHLWSLGVEAQFYLLWPLLLARFTIGQHGHPWWLVALTGCGFLLSMAIYAYSPALEFYGPASRTWEFALGGAVAFMWRNAEKKHRDAATMGRRVEYTWLVLMVILLSCFIMLDSVNGVEPALRVIPVVAVTALIAMSGRSVLGGVLLAGPAARWLGNISYPLYLWHWPLLAFYQIVFDRLPHGSAALLLGLASIGFAGLTYHYVERPFQQWARTPYGRTNAVRMAGGLALVLLVAMGLSLGDEGWQGRGTRYVRQLQQVDWSYKSNAVCESRFEAPPPYCVAAGKGNPDGVAILGDSVSNALYPGIAQVLQRSNINVWNIGKPGCPPIVNVEKLVGSREIGCTGITSAAMNFVISEPSISTVIVAGAFASYVGGRSYRPGWDAAPQLITLRTPGNAETGLSNDAVFQRGLAETFGTLLEAGKRVVFVHQVPEFDFDPAGRCLKGRPVTFNGLPPQPCAVDRKAMERYQAAYRDVVKNILHQFPNVKVLDPMALFCDDELCYAMRDGVLLYRDRNHLSVRGSELVATFLNEGLGQDQRAIVSNIREN